MNSTLDELKMLVTKNLGIAPEILDADQSLEDFGMDSLQLGELFFAIEDYFSIQFPNVQPADIKTLKTLSDVIEQSLYKKAA